MRSMGTDNRYEIFCKSAYNLRIYIDCIFLVEGKEVGLTSLDTLDTLYAGQLSWSYNISLMKSNEYVRCLSLSTIS